MEYSRKLKPGDGACDRITGKILLSESLRHASEAEVLRVAFHEAGHYYARSFRRDVLPLYLAAFFAVLLAACVSFSQVRGVIHDWLPFFGLFGSILAFETGRRHWENAANAWALEHWPKDLSDRDLRYF
jgi:Zn-dependent protease with chaperone function